MRRVICFALAAPLATGLALPAAAGTPASAAPRSESRACLFNKDIRAKRLSAEKGYFAQTNRGWWHNQGAACPTYAPTRALQTNGYEDRQCDGDLVQVFEPRTRVTFGGCVLGRWQLLAGAPDVPAPR